MFECKRAVTGAALAVALAACGLVPPAAADDLVQVNGTHWSDASTVEKRAYLIGMANMIEAERAYRRETAPDAPASLSDRTAQGIDDVSIDAVRERIDAWYEANPSRLETPVLGVIWIDLVKPELGQ